MFGIRAFAAAALAALSVGAAEAAPLEAYGRLPTIENAAIAPDASAVALVWTDGELRKIAILGLPDGKVRQVINAGETKLRDVQWAGPEHLLITTSQTKDVAELVGGKNEWFMASDLNLRTGKLRNLLERGDSIMNVVHDAPQVRFQDGKPIVYVRGAYNEYGKEYLATALYRVDLERQTAKRVATGDWGTLDWVIDQAGEPIARVDYNSESRRWSLFLHQGSSWNLVKVVRDLPAPTPLVGLAADGKSVLVWDPEPEEPALRQVSIDGSWGEPLKQQDEALLFDPARHNLIGFYKLAGDKDRYTFLDAADQKAWDAIAAKFKGARVRIVSSSDDRRSLLLRVDDPVQGPAYVLADTTSGGLKGLGRSYAKLSETDIAPMTPFVFKAKDGRTLSAYLTAPRGVEPANLPLVALPHGGPASRDELGFDWWAQALASRGYAVLQVNFRGSEGLGDDLLEAGYGQWGRKMQTDLSDGVRALAAEGVIDPKRVCIVGASYGGYAALAGAAIDTGVYRCAASVAGISDVRRFVAWSKTQNGVTAQRYWTSYIGAEDARDPVLTQISPAAFADRVSIPVLLIHGRDDTTVPIEQSRIMEDALKRAGKPVQMVTLDGTDHYLLRGDTRLAMLKAVVAFLEAHNPPK